MILGDIVTIPAHINIPKFVRDRNMSIDLNIQKYTSELNKRESIKSKRITFVSYNNSIPNLDLVKRLNLHRSYNSFIQTNWWGSNKGGQS